jgi:hypothetical protein
MNKYKVVTYRQDGSRFTSKTEDMRQAKALEKISMRAGAKRVEILENKPNKKKRQSDPFDMGLKGWGKNFRF